MNTFDTVHLGNIFVPDFDLSKLKCSYNSHQIADQSNGNMYWQYTLHTSKLLGIANVKVNEFGFFEITISSKILEQRYFDLINENTIGIVVEQLNENVYSGFDLKMLLHSEVWELHCTKDVVLSEKQMTKLRSLFFAREYRMKIVPNNGNLIFDRKSETYPLYLTIYDKHLEFNRSTKTNNKLRAIIEEHPTTGTYRVETKLQSVDAIRRKLTGSIRENNSSVDKKTNRDFEFKGTLVKPTLQDAFNSSIDVISNDLKQLFSNVMVKPNRRLSETELMLYSLLQRLDFDRLKVKAVLVENYNYNYYRKTYSKKLSDIIDECKSLKPSGNSVQDVFESVLN